MSNQQSNCSFTSVPDLDNHSGDLYRRTNVIGRSEVAQNPSNVEIRSRLIQAKQRKRKVIRVYMRGLIIHFHNGGVTFLYLENGEPCKKSTVVSSDG